MNLSNCDAKSISFELIPYKEIDSVLDNDEINQLENELAPNEITGFYPCGQTYAGNTKIMVVYKNKEGYYSCLFSKLNGVGFVFGPCKTKASAISNIECFGVVVDSR